MSKGRRFDRLRDLAFIIETIFWEQPLQLSITQHLPIQFFDMSHRCEIIDLGGILIAINLPRDAAFGRLPAEVAHADLVLADVRFFHL